MTCAAAGQCGAILLQLLIIGLTNGAAIALNAMAVTLVFGVVRTVNFAHGDVFALTTALVVTLITRLDLPGRSVPAIAGGLTLAFAGAVLFGCALNAAVERLAFRPFRATSRLAPLIATLGISFVLYQVAIIWRVFEPSFVPQEHRSVPGLPEVPKGGIPDLLPALALGGPPGSLGASITLKDAVVVALAGTCALAIGWFLRRTRSGAALRACAQNPELAQLCGIDLNAAIGRTFVLGGALAGAAGFVYTVFYTHPFGQHGVQSGLIALAAAVLGGVGRPGGAFFAGLLLGVLGAFGDYLLAAQWTPVLVQGALVLLLALRPGGLAGEEAGTAAEPARDAVISRPAGGRGHSRSWVAWAGLALAITYPALDAALGVHRQVAVTTLLIFGVLALGLNLLLGFAGLLDLGYAASFGVGAYSAALLTSPGGRLAAALPQPVDVLLVLPLAAMAGGAFGALNGVLALRLRSDYLAIVTLALGQVVVLAVTNVPAWTGGAGGLAALPAPHLLTHALAAASERYYLALVPLVLVFVASRRLRQSRLGRAWLALGDDEQAAASCGVSPGPAKLLVFTLSAAVAGVAGALFAGILSYVDPEQIGFRISAMALAMVIVGGAGSVPGVLLGAILIGAYDRLAIPLLGAALDGLRLGNAGGGLVVLDVRGLSYLSFGLALYFTVLLRARPRPATGGRRLALPPLVRRTLSRRWAAVSCAGAVRPVDGGPRERKSDEDRAL